MTDLPQSDSEKRKRPVATRATLAAVRPWLDGLNGLSAMGRVMGLFEGGLGIALEDKEFTRWLGECSAACILERRLADLVARYRAITPRLDDA